MEATKNNPTILHFIYILDELKELKHFFKMIKFQYAGITSNFQNSNDIKIDIQLDENNIYYNEIIDFYTYENSDYPAFSCDYPIYKNKINNIYIDFEKQDKKENDKYVTIEMMYQSLENELIQKKVFYGEKELSLFDTFKNKLRRRIGLFNINPNKLNFTVDIYDQYPNFKFNDQICYQIFARIPLEGKIQYSLTITDFIRPNLKKTIKKIIINKEKLLKLLMEFKNNFNMFLENFLNKNNVDENDINKLFEQSKIIKIECESYYNNVLNYNEFENIDIEIFSLILHYLEFCEIGKIYQDERKKKLLLKSKLLFLSNYSKDFEKYISVIKELDCEIKDKLLIIKVYNLKFINSLQSGKEIYYISVLDISKAKETNPYCKAINFIKDIILNLKEESRLFEIFLYLDSDIIHNLLIEREEKSYIYEDIYSNKKVIKLKKNPTEYGINMSNIDEVRLHLYKLIPKYIIRIDSDMKFNANYDPSSKIMTLNEKQLFKNKSIFLDNIFQSIEESEPYVLPIVIEILHEIYGHGKKRFLNENEISAEEYRDSKHNYQRCQIKKKIKSFDEIIDFPESGEVFENYISENRQILKWLRKLHGKNEEKKLMDVSLWVDKDFNKLENIVKSFINLDENEANGNSQNLYQISINSNDEDFIDSDSETCGFHFC